jgi:hypothetical protein
MRHWFRPYPESQREEMHAENGKKLFIKLTRPNLGHSTDVNGFIYRKGGWVYGNSRGVEWAVPESAIVGIEEA